MSRYLAIDVDPQGLFLVAGASARGGAVKVEHALAWTGDTLPPLTPDTARAIGEGLRERLKAAHIPPAPVLVAVGRDKVILKELKYPAVPPAEEPALVRFQAMKELTESPDDVVLDYAPLDGPAPAAGKWPTGDGPDRRSMAVVVRKEVFAAVRTMCEAAGLKLAAVTPRPYAVAAGLARGIAAGTVPPPPQPTDAVAAVTLGTQGGEFTVVRGGQVTFTRSVPAPVLANDSLLLVEVKRNLAVYAGQQPAHPVTALYVAEGGFGRWASRLDGALPVPVHSVDPLASATADVEPELHGRFAGAAGLLAGQAADALPINFASPRQPKPETDPNRRKYILAAVAAALVLAAGWGVGLLQVARAKDRVEGLAAEKQQAEAALATFAVDQKRMEAVDQWTAPEVVWLDELFDLADRLPAGDRVRVNALTATQIPADKAGKREAAARLELRVGAKSPAAVDALQTGFDRDNAIGTRYYLNTRKTVGGAVTGKKTDFKELFVLETRVNHRRPDQYTRQPASFSPPHRRAGVNVVVGTPDKDPDPKDPDKKDAKPEDDDGTEL